MPEFEGVFRRPFAEQVAAFRLRLQKLEKTTRWDAITRNQHDRAFMVAGAAKADLLGDLAEAVDRAIADGTGFDAFRRDFRAIVEKNGWHGWTGEGTRAGENWRMRTIYRTNIMTTYHAGRFAQLRKGGFKYWVYRHGGSEHPRLHHLGWDGLILPADHPFWSTHFPPNGWGCSCYVVGSHSRKGAIAKGGDPSKSLPDNWRDLDPRTGAPVGVGKNWDYAPGAPLAETISLAAQKLRQQPALLGAQYGGDLNGIIDRFWPMWVADVLAGGRHQPGLLGAIGQKELKALSNAGVRPRSAEIMVSPGLVAGPKARRHAIAGDALSDDDWLRLPTLLRAPVAVLREKQTGKLFYILSGDRGTPQMVVEFDYWVKRETRDREAVNMVRSVYYRDVVDLRGRIRSGQFDVLSGGIE